MRIRSVGGAIVFMIAVFAAIAMKYQHKSEAGAEIKAEVRQMLVKADGFEKYHEYFDSLLENAHEEAFDVAYHMGMGRHQRSTFDADTYINKVFPLMIERANSEGATHIGAAIEKVYKAEVLDDPPPAPQPAKPKRK